MNGETNENLDELNVENAFSDLLLEYFTDENNTTNAGNISVGPVLDWDSVANGQLYTNITAEGIQNTLENQMNNAGTTGNNVGTINTGDLGNNGVLYNNLGTITGGDNQTQEAGNVTNGNGGLYTNLGTIGGEYTNLENQNVGNGEEYTNNETTDNENTQQQNATNILFNEFGEINKEKLVKTAYNAATFNGELIKEVNAGVQLGLNEGNGINATNTNGTDFKLTQANLPAKIGFWTKVRNFFISDSKIGYSVQQSAQGNTGVWNKIQNFFSFGKSEK